MADFKGFGTPPMEPKATLIRLENGTREEMDRAMRGYLRQGLSQKEALNCVAASVMFLAAREAGMVEGVDYLWSDAGTSMSPRMAEWVKSTMPEQHWNHMAMEGFITKVEPEPEPKVMLSPKGLAKLALINAKDPDDPNVDPEKAQRCCIDLLKAAGLSQFDAESKLRRFLNGDNSLEDDLLLLMEAGARVLFVRKQDQ